MRTGKPIAEIQPVAVPPEALRPFGLCAGEFTVPEDFDAPLPEDIINAFEGAWGDPKRSLLSRVQGSSASPLQALIGLWCSPLSRQF